MTWVLLIWTIAMAAVVLTFGPAIAFFVWSLGFATLSALWFMTRPLWRRATARAFAD